MLIFVANSVMILLGNIVFSKCWSESRTNLWL